MATGPTLTPTTPVGTSLAGELAVFGDLLDRFALLDLGALAVDEIAAGVVCLQRLTDRCTAELARFVSAADAATVWAGSGNNNIVGWLAEHSHSGYGHAVELTRLADAMDANPTLARNVRGGTMSTATAVALGATVLAPPVGATADDIEMLIQACTNTDPKHARATAELWKTEHETCDQATLAARRFARRGIRFSHPVDGMIALTGQFPTFEASQIRKVLTSFGGGRPHANDTRTPEQRVADGLLTLTRHAALTNQAGGPHQTDGVGGCGGTGVTSRTSSAGGSGVGGAGSGRSASGATGTGGALGPGGPAGAGGAGGATASTPANHNDNRNDGNRGGGGGGGGGSLFDLDLEVGSDLRTGEAGQIEHGNGNGADSDGPDSWPPDDRPPDGDPPDGDPTDDQPPNDHRTPDGQQPDDQPPDDGGSPGRYRPAGGTQAAKLLVTIPVDVLSGISDGHAWDEYDQPIPGVVARGVAEHVLAGDLVPVVHDGTVVLSVGSKTCLDLGRTSRTRSPAQYVALLVRDGRCRWPGCTRPASWCQVDHRVPWERGGRTDLNNLWLLCSEHHSEKHRAGTVCTGDTNGTVHIELPNGIFLTSPPGGPITRTPN